MSTETNFTPGPWSLDSNDVRDEAQAVVSDATGCIVAEAYTLDRPGDCEANAHLIAAAPELYEALGRLVSDVERGVHVEFGGTPWVKGKLAEIGYARAALSKARGET